MNEDFAFSLYTFVFSYFKPRNASPENVAFFNEPSVWMNMYNT